MNSINNFLPASDSLFANSLSQGKGTSTNKESIAQVGEEFESVFVSMLLKNMRQTVSGDGMFAGDKSDTIGGMFDLFMSQHIASSDSLGIGAMIETFLSNSNSAENRLETTDTQ